jgi:hypothetical protein
LTSKLIVKKGCRDMATADTSDKPTSDKSSDKPKGVYERVLEMNAVIDVKPDADSKFPMRASVYRGIGNVRKTIPQGEISVRSGDIMVELPGGIYALDQLSALALFGDSIADLLFVDPLRSQKEREDLSSPTHPDTVRDYERMRLEAEQQNQDLETRRENARLAEEAARNQNFGGELKVPQMHVRNVGGEFRLMPGPHPATMNPDLELLTEEEKVHRDEQKSRLAASGRPVGSSQLPGSGMPPPGINIERTSQESSQENADMAGFKASVEQTESAKKRK